MNIVTTYGSYDYDIVDTIVSFCIAYDLPQIQMIAIALQECGMFGTGFDLYAKGAYNPETKEYMRRGIYQLPKGYSDTDSVPWPLLAVGLHGLRISMNCLFVRRWEEVWRTSGGWPMVAYRPVGWLRMWASSMQDSPAWSEELAGIRYTQALLIYLQYTKRVEVMKINNAAERVYNRTKNLETLVDDIYHILETELGSQHDDEDVARNFVNDPIQPANQLTNT